MSPSCGLRDSQILPISNTDRWPICLGTTESVWKGVLPTQESIQASRVPRPVALEVLLDTVRSGQNVGSILRSAEALGVLRVYLVGITPTPAQPDVKKTALGAEAIIQSSHHYNGLTSAQPLHASGRQVWAIENAPQSVPLRRSAALGSTTPAPVLVIGNEVTGVDPGIVEIADRVLCVSMRDRKTSFNAAVAFALAACLLSADWDHRWLPSTANPA